MTVGVRAEFTSNGVCASLRGDGLVHRERTTSAASEYFPQWSPGGKWIAFASPAVDNVLRLWRSPASGGPQERLTKDRAFYFRWSRDGKRIYFLRGSDVWVVTLATGHERRLTRFSQQTGELARHLALAVGEAHLYFTWANDLGGLRVADGRVRPRENNLQAESNIRSGTLSGVERSAGQPRR